MWERQERRALKCVLNPLQIKTSFNQTPIPRGRHCPTQSSRFQAPPPTSPGLGRTHCRQHGGLQAFIRNSAAACLTGLCGCNSSVFSTVTRERGAEGRRPLGGPPLQRKGTGPGDTAPSGEGWVPTHQGERVDAENSKLNTAKAARGWGAGLHLGSPSRKGGSGRRWSL